MIILLAIMWCIVFLIPPPKKNKNRARLLLLTRIAAIWWVLGMAYYFLGFLMPENALLNAVDFIFSYTIALPCRLGIGLENARVGAFELVRFDLAVAMIFGLPVSFILTPLVVGLYLALTKKRVAQQRTS